MLALEKRLAETAKLIRLGSFEAGSKANHLYGLRPTEASLTVVSFDIFVQGFRGGARFEIDRDLFVAALGSSLKRAGTNFDVETPDDGSAEVYGLDEDPFDGCMFALHGDLSPMLADTIVAAARAGKCAIYWPGDDPIFAYPDPAILSDLPSNAEAPTPVHCESGSELRVLVRSGLRAWKKYRDQVVREAES